MPVDIGDDSIPSRLIGHIDLRTQCFSETSQRSATSVTLHVLFGPAHARRTGAPAALLHEWSGWKVGRELTQGVGAV